MSVRLEPEHNSEGERSTERAEQNHTVRVVLGLTLFGAALRIGWLFVAHPAPVSDFLGYASLANRWLTTGQYARFGSPTAYRTPGYPAFLALGMSVSRATFWLS